VDVAVTGIGVVVVRFGFCVCVWVGSVSAVLVLKGFATEKLCAKTLVMAGICLYIFLQVSFLLKERKPLCFFCRESF